jgi:anti-anti-sigma factor
MVDGEVVIAPRGRLVRGGLILADVSQAMEQALTNWRGVALDLSRIEKIDAAGLGWIARCYASAVQQRVSFRLLSPTRRMQEILRITRLVEVIPISCDTDEECLVACEAGAG